MKHTRIYPVNCAVLVTRRHFIHELMRVESARSSVHKPNHCPTIVGHASQRRRNVLSPHVFLNREAGRDLGLKTVQLPFTARTAPPNCGSQPKVMSYSSAVRSQRRRTQSGLRNTVARTPGGGLFASGALGCGRYVAATFHATSTRNQ
jgi:hypothetical protein